MKALLLIFQFGIIPLLLTQTTDLEIGKPLPKNIEILDTSKNNLQIINAGSMVPAIKIKYHDINYNVVLTHEKKVSFIITFDPKYKTKDGFIIGTSYRDVKKKYNSKTSFESGLGYSIELPSGWKALFTGDGIVSEKQLYDTSRIKSFFKSN